MITVLLDSDAYTYFIKGSREVEKEIEKADKVYMSAIVLGELLAAFKKGKKEKQNLNLLKRFLSKLTVEIVNVTKETAEVYANTKELLEKADTPIPTNDLWIASQALETGSVLVTYDRHFLNVSSLRLWHKLD